MAKRCPNCRSEITPYQEFCYSCGQEIKHVSKRPRRESSIHLGYFLLGFVIPIAGYAWFFFFSRDNYDKARSAFIGAISSTIVSFIGYRLLSYLGYFEVPEVESGAALVNIVRFAIKF